MKIAKNRLVMIKEKEMEYDYLKSTESVYNFLKYKVELHIVMLQEVIFHNLF